MDLKSWSCGSGIVADVNLSLCLMYRRPLSLNHELVLNRRTVHSQFRHELTPPTSLCTLSLCTAARQPDTHTPPGVKLSFYALLDAADTA